MALATYTDLLTSVANFVHRTDLTSRIPDYVVLAEAEMNRTLAARAQIARTTVSITGEYLSLPADFSGVRAFRLTDGNHSTLSYAGPEEMAGWKDQNTATGEPRYYTIVGSEFEFYPVPGATYTGSISYYKNIPALASNSTNWLLTAHPDVYLKGALKYAYIDVKDDERAALADQQFQAAMEAVNAQSVTDSLGGALTPSASGMVV